MNCGNTKRAFMLNFVKQNGFSAYHTLCRLKFLMKTEVVYYLIQQFIITASFVGSIYNFTNLTQL